MDTPAYGFTNGTGEGTSELKVSGGSTGLNRSASALHGEGAVPRPKRKRRRGPVGHDRHGRRHFGATGRRRQQLRPQSARLNSLTAASCYSRATAPMTTPDYGSPMARPRALRSWRSAPPAALASILMASFPITERCYSRATTRTGDNGLWVTDGTAAGTTELQVRDASSNFSPGDFTIVNGKVVFSGWD